MSPIDALRRIVTINQAAAGRNMTNAQQRDYAQAAAVIIDPSMTIDADSAAGRMYARASAVLSTAIAEGRDLSPAELSRVQIIADQLDGIADVERRSAIAAPFRARFAGLDSGTYTGGSQHVYSPDGPSYFRDVVGASRGDYDAAERLHRHQSGAEDRERRDGTTIGTTSMGSFIPPVWLVDQVAAKARVGRVLAPLLTQGGFPTSNSMTIPRITTGSSTASQAGDNAVVSETDIITAQLTRTTVTIAGQQDVSVQSLDLGSAGVDALIYADLRGAYEAELDRQILRGSGTNELLGMNQIVGINTVSYTDASPTVGELYPKVADAIQQIATARFAGAEAIVMHPRRWAWILAALDTTNRPLVAPSGAGFNGIAAFSSPDAQGRVGQMAGLPIYVDANVSTTLGGGTEDQIVIVRASDSVLYESPVKTRIMEQTLSGNLTVRFQLWAYANLFAGRFPASISTIGSTGLIAPTF